MNIFEGLQEGDKILTQKGDTGTYSGHIGECHYVEVNGKRYSCDQEGKAEQGEAWILGAISRVTIAQVLTTDKYLLNLKAVMQEAETTRKNAFVQAQARHQELRAHPIDEFMRKGLWVLPVINLEYARVLDKVSSLHKSQRDFVQMIGQTAFHKTMEEINSNN